MTQQVLDALLGTPDPPVNYALSTSDVDAIAACYDWESRVTEANWLRDSLDLSTPRYETLAAFVAAEPGSFLADISRYYGDDYYIEADMDFDEDEDEDEDEDPWVQWLCGCGQGSLKIRASEVPENCPVCGTPTAAHG